MKKSKNKQYEFGAQKDGYFAIEEIAKYFFQNTNNQSDRVLSDRICNDLDFDEFYQYADRCASSTGQQYLYNHLRLTEVGIPETENDETLIARFKENAALRNRVVKTLSKLKSNKAYYLVDLFFGEQIKQPSWFFIVKLLSFASILSFIFIFVDTTFILVSIILATINSGIHYWNKRNLQVYVDSIPQLMLMYAVAVELNKIDELKGKFGISKQSIAVLKTIRNKVWVFKLESKIDSDLMSIAWGLVEFVKIAFLIEPVLLFNAIAQIKNKAKEIEQVFAFIGHVDLLLSIASLRNGTLNHCIPSFNQNMKMDVEGMVHPLILNCISNDIALDSKSVLLTGSNMSGKTTFIRTMGLNVISALRLNTCFATTFSMPRVKLVTAIRMNDDLMNDKSYYFDEVLRIKEMIESSRSGEINMFLLDEIFKGTNTIERISAGKAVLEHLSKGNFVFVSTHDVELAELLKNNFQLFHFSEMVSDAGIDFDYKLKPGKLTTRNAIKILKYNGYPEHIIREALETSKLLDGKSGV